PRNAKGCEVCDTCNFGCYFGAKQSTLKTYLQDAHDHGARIVVRAQADRITHAAGQVTGAELTVQGANGQTHRVTVKAKRVVAAGGSIQTPALLLRSGLTNPHVGGNLRTTPRKSGRGRVRRRPVPRSNSPTLTARVTVFGWRPPRRTPACSRWHSCGRMARNTSASWPIWPIRGI
ncbi:MAG: GMC family oxidoreductase N-terminal domain-containing protein, partial [Anaerolineae bacterium]|nr:GMC family oxidoreductase N-terminal domain-containing protein [Anaerolineae bacterium]